MGQWLPRQCFRPRGGELVLKRIIAIALTAGLLFAGCESNMDYAVETCGDSGVESFNQEDSDSYNFVCGDGDGHGVFPDTGG